MNKPYTRPLSPLERYFLAVNEVYRFNAELVVEGEGDVDAGNLRHAVAVASAANPGMRVRLRGALGFCRWVDSGVTPEVREVTASEWDGASEHGAGFLEERFRPLQGGAVAHVLLVHGDPARGQPTRIVLRVLHGAADGKGLAHWMHDILRVLRGEQPLGSGNTLTDIEFARSVIEKNGLELAPPVPPATPAATLLPPSPDDGSPFRFTWRCTKFDRNISNPLPKILHFLRSEAPGSGEIRITVPIDYRSQHGAEAGTGNLTGYLQLRIDEHDTPKTIMGKLGDGLRQRRDCAIGILPFWRLNWIPIRLLALHVRKNLEKSLFSEGTDMPNGGISSLGMTPLEAISFPGFRGIGGYGLATVGRLYVSVTNFPAATYVMLAAPARYNRDGQLDRLAARLRETFA